MNHERQGQSPNARAPMRPPRLLTSLLATTILVLSLLGMHTGSVAAQYNWNFTVCPGGVIVYGNVCPAMTQCPDGSWVGYGYPCPGDSDTGDPGDEGIGDEGDGSGSEGVPSEPVQPLILITSVPEAAHACKKGGYASLERYEDGSGFRNTGDCVSHVAQGGWIRVVGD